MLLKMSKLIFELVYLQLVKSFVFKKNCFLFSKSKYDLRQIYWKTISCKIHKLIVTDNVVLPNNQNMHRVYAI